MKSVRAQSEGGLIMVPQETEQFAKIARLVLYQPVVKTTVPAARK